MVAGESVFILPFLLSRIFRPTFLSVFQLTNFELGSLYSIYGIIAMLSYVFGGAIADRFAPKKLMAISLIMTAMGGYLLATFPSYYILQFIYAYWGFSTIFLFWAAMIKATRSWGGLNRQGKAFGLLEGGRGIVAASIGALGVAVFALFLPEHIQSTSFGDRQNAFRAVILLASSMIIVIGFLVLLFLKNNIIQTKSTVSKKASWEKILKVIKIPAVWLLVLIVLSAYVGYKVTDILSLYAAEVMLFDEVNAARVGSYQMYLRPIVCISIGFFADRTSNSIWLIIGFIILLVGALMFASGNVQSPLNALFFLSVIITGIGTYGLRTLYFASIQEGNIPYAITGTAVGVISIIGYTPDIFMGPIMGQLLDQNPGVKGHQYVFGLLAVFAFIGLITSIKFRSMVKKK